MLRRACLTSFLGMGILSSIAAAAEPAWGPWYRIGPFAGAKDVGTPFPPEKSVDLKATHGKLAWEREVPRCSGGRGAWRVRKKGIPREWGRGKRGQATFPGVDCGGW